ncbi:MAG: hypothetical protein ACI9IN_001836, partial [Porticoccaceae bacterium]
MSQKSIASEVVQVDFENTIRILLHTISLMGG